MSRLVRPLLAAAALVLAVALPLCAPALGQGATPSQVPGSRGPLLWTRPAGVDVAPIDGVSCPSTRLCVAVDRAGDVLWSANPAGGANAWQVADVDGSNELTSIACPSASLCVAVDGAGNAVTSQNPAGGGATWSIAKIDASSTQNNTDSAGPVLLRGVACPSTGLCVAVDSVGNALTSTNPAGGPAAWTITRADTNRTYGCRGGGLTCQPPLVGVSCPSTAQCAAVDFSGNVLTSRTPTAAGPWSSVSAHGAGPGSLWGISCPTAGFCATVDGGGGHVVTFNPVTPRVLHSHALSAAAYGIWCRSASLCQVSAQPRGGLSTVLGSYNPGGRSPTWSQSPLGAINAMACPSAALCIAGDDQGNIVAGETTRALTTLLRGTVLSTRRLPTMSALERTPRLRFALPSQIPGNVALTWTVPGVRAPITLASTAHTFGRPGATTLTLRLNPTGVHRLHAAAKRLAVTATATFTASTGILRTTRTLTFTRPPARHKPKGK